MSKMPRELYQLLKDCVSEDKQVYLAAQTKLAKMLAEPLVMKVRDSKGTENEPNN